MLHKTLCTVLFLCAYALPVFPQFNAPSFNPAINPVPKTPEAASLIKFIEAPVSKATGIPDIQIPVTTLREGDMEVPITLSYHAGGHKVAEMAAWTGLGWRLNAGGSITRQVKGLPDDSEKGQGFLQFRTTQTYNGLLDKLSAQDADYFFNLSNGCYDTQPDEFYFQMGKYTGRFAFDWTGSLPVVSSKDDIKILSYTVSTSPGTKTIMSWKLVAPDGYIYDFANTEQTSVNNGSPNLQSPCFIGINNYVSSWMLTRITSPYNAAHYIEFTYSGYLLSGSWDGYEVATFVDPNVPKPQDCAMMSYQGISTYSSSRTDISGLQLKKITTYPGNLTLECFGSTIRTDLGGLWNNNNNNWALFALDTIRVKDAANKIIGRHIFTYDYSSGRLTLKTFRQDGSAGVNPGKYEFSYYRGNIPNIISKDIDHWGFYNRSYNITLIPTYKYVAYMGGNNYTVNTFNGANREPDLEGVRSGILSQMKQPTGGVSEFDYELNTYGHVDGMRLEDANEYYYRDSLIQAFANGNYGSFDWVYDTKTVVITEAGIYDITIAGATWCTFAGATYLPRASISTQSGTVLYNKQLVNHDGSDSPTYQSYPHPMFLTPGTYVLSAQARYYTIGHPIAPDNISVYFYQRVKGEKILEKTAGGLRVKTIRFRNEPLSPPITRRYEYKLDNGRSSGYIYAEPVYKYSGKTLGITSECYYVNLVASNQVMTGGTQGNHAGYTNVTEYFGPNGEEGKTVTEFAFHQDIVNITKPFAPPTSETYRTGLPLKETIYKKSGATYIRQKQTTTSYLFKPFDINTMKVSYGQLSPPAAGSSFQNSQWYSIMPFDQKFAFWWTTLRLGHVQTTSVTDSVWENSVALGKAVNMEYDANGKYLKRMWQIASNTDTDEKLFKYPKEYTTAAAGDAMNDAVKKLVEKNMVNLPIETYVKKNNKIVQGNIVKYGLYHSTLPLPSAYLSLEPAAPLTSFTESAFSGGSFTFAADYKQKTAYNAYLNDGRLTEQTPTGDKKSAYLWDDSGNNLLAEVQNAAANTIYHTSFESGANGNWTINSAARIADAVTGKVCYNVANGISLSGLSSTTTYTFTVWVKSGSLTVSNAQAPITGPTIKGWTLYEYTITGAGNISLSGSGLIDELRLYPGGARMTTFSYAPGVGVTSRCDVNNRIVYYDYDDQSRLAIIRDEQGNIIKKMEYHYK